MKKILTCFVLIIVLYSCKSGMGGSPKNTVTSFIEASREGNLVNVKKYITRSDVSMLEIGENFLAKFDPDGAKGMKDKMMKEFKEKTKDAKVEIKDEKIDGDNATVNVEFIHAGKSETRPFSLVKEDGQWKLSLLSTGMKNSGSNEEDVKEAMKNLNLDSLQGSIRQGMEELNKLDKDSLKNAMKEGMKELNKLNNDSLKKVMEEGLKELEKLKDIPKQQ